LKGTSIARFCDTIATTLFELGALRVYHPHSFPRCRQSFIGELGLREHI
jgi:hypothetical protein